MKKYLKTLATYIVMMPLLLLTFALYYIGAVIKSVAYLASFQLDAAKRELESITLR